MRLGLTPFPLSIRNSPIAVAHLIKKTQLLQVFVSPDPAMQRLITEAKEILRKEDGTEVEVLEMIKFEDVDDEGGSSGAGDSVAVAQSDELKFPKLDLDSTAIILHSSGKLIHYDIGALMMNMLISLALPSFCLQVPLPSLNRFTSPKELFFSGALSLVSIHFRFLLLIM